MIRDPSDGSVKEMIGDAEEISAQIPQTEGGMNIRSAIPLASGLPTGSGKSKDLKRLEESREWLANYHKKAGSI